MADKNCGIRLRRMADFIDFFCVTEHIVKETVTSIFNPKSVSLSK